MLSPESLKAFLNSELTARTFADRIAGAMPVGDTEEDHDEWSEEWGAAYADTQYAREHCASKEQFDAAAASWPLTPQKLADAIGLAAANGHTGPTISREVAGLGRLIVRDCAATESAEGDAYNHLVTHLNDPELAAETPVRNGLEADWYAAKATHEAAMLRSGAEITALAKGCTNPGLFWELAATWYGTPAELAASVDDLRSR